MLLGIFSILTLSVFALPQVFAVEDVMDTISVGDGAAGIAVNPRFNTIYVANNDDDTVSIISGGVVNSVIDTISVGINPSVVAVNPDTNKIYVVNNGLFGTQKSISVIDGFTFTVVDTIPVADGNAITSIAVNPDTNKIYVVRDEDAGGGSVSVIDGSDNSVDATISVGINPSGVAVNPTTNTIYVVNSGVFGVGEFVSVIDGSDNSVDAAIPVGDSPAGIAVNPRTNLIYVVNNDDKTVSIIAGGANTVIDTISVGGNPVGIAVNPTTNKIYVTNLQFVDVVVSVIDGTSFTVVDTVPVDSFPILVAVNPDTNLIYVTHLDDKVSVIGGDIDEDGIPDIVERFGIRDSNGDILVDMAALGADPCRKTIAVEIDYMVDNDGTADDHTHEPMTSALDAIIASFDGAPVSAESCPYPGFPTQLSGVHLIVDVDDALPHQDIVDLDNGFDTIKNNNFDEERKPYFHYNLWVHDLKDGSSTSGRGEVNGNDFIVSLGSWANSTGTPSQQAGTFQHELGHNLGFRHGGDDKDNRKPNYLSVMSYTFQTVGIGDNVGTINPDAMIGNFRFDYSRSELPPLVESELDENAGIGDGTDFTFWGVDDGTGTGARTSAGGQGNGPLDWNNISGIEAGTIPADINNFSTGSSPSDTLSGFDDWANIDYQFRDNDDFEDGVHGVPDELELTFEDAQIIEQFVEKFFNTPPEADASGPYETPEGTDIVLDGTGSSDPDGDPITYEWDFDNDGLFDDATGPTPTYDDVGDNKVVTIKLKVTDDNEAFDVDETTLTVTNVAPTIDTLSADDPIDEGQTVTVDGTASDPGWLDDLSATIDWDDGNGVQNIPGGTQENVRPDATLEFSDSLLYGDDGIFNTQVCVEDDDGGVDCNDLDITVNNVSPTAAIDESSTIVINGMNVFLATIGEDIDFSGNSQDPGSDDLTISWDWDDGPPSPDVSTDYLVNDPLLDPPKSPTDQPRDVTDDQTHAFADACLYEIVLASDDDDGGHGEDSATVIIVGDAEQIRSAGYWEQQVQFTQQNKKNADFESETLLCYLDIIKVTSQIFDEQESLSTLQDARDILKVGNKTTQHDQLLRQILASWLNFTNGSIAIDELVDTDADNVPDSVFSDVISDAEAVFLNPASTTEELSEQIAILDSVNNTDG